MTFRIGQHVRAIYPTWARGISMQVTSEPHHLGHVPRTSTYYGMDPRTIIVGVDLPAHPPGHYCAWPTEWLADDGDGTQKGEWTESLRDVCRSKQTEDA
jgi:hypothetical protein